MDFSPTDPVYSKDKKIKERMCSEKLIGFLLNLGKFYLEIAEECH